MRILAFAKFNLYLRVTGRLPGGYHALETVMQTVTLADVLTVTPAPGSGVRFTCSDRSLAGEGNLVPAACDAFFRRTGLSGGFSVSLEKHIPVAGGLGGGSSDAAAMLNALNRYFGEPLRVSELESLALSLGSDVPFFIRGGCALAGGRGERLERLKRNVGYYYVALIAGVKRSTGDMYAALDRVRRKESAPSPDFGRLVNDFDYLADHAHNDFTEVFSVPSEVRADFLAAGAECICLSGSGPAVFAVFRDWDSARSAYRFIQKKYPASFIAADSSRGSLPA